MGNAALDRLTKSLATAVDDAVKQQDIDNSAAQILSIILMRTSRGQFLTPSGGTEKKTYKSETHKQKRSDLGLPTDRVTLFMGPHKVNRGRGEKQTQETVHVGVLEALRTRATIRQGKADISVGFIEGLSEERASEIGGYLTKDGAGKNKVKFPFVGLANDEEDKVLAALSVRIHANMRTNVEGK